MDRDLWHIQKIIEAEDKSIIFVNGNEEDIDNFLSLLIFRLDNKAVIIRKRLLKGKKKKCPLHNYKDAQYLIATGVKRKDLEELNKGAMKALSEADAEFCKVTYNIVKPTCPKKLVVFCDKRISESDICHKNEVGFLRRLNIIDISK